MMSVKYRSYRSVFSFSFIYFSENW